MTCTGDTGSVTLPEPGPIDVVLALGAQPARFCAKCGGKTVGKQTRAFKRKACPAPASCP